MRKLLHGFVACFIAVFIASISFAENTGDIFSIHGITWDTPCEEAEQILLDTGFSRGGFYDFLSPQGQYVFDKGEAFGAQVNNFSVTYKGKMINSFSISYKSNKDSYKTVMTSLVSIYGEPKIGEYTYATTNGTHSVEAAIWNIFDSDVYLSPTLPTDKLANAKNGTCQFVINAIRSSNIDTNFKFSIRQGVSFGMSKANVINIEGEPDKTFENDFVYNTSALNRDVVLAYYFNQQDNLERIGYLFTAEHTTDNLYIDDYNEIQTSLTSKYGSPSAAGLLWKNDLYKDDPNSYGFAVSIGNLSYNSVWEINSVRISHIMNGDNYKINHMITYESTDGSYMQNTPDDI